MLVDWLTLVFALIANSLGLKNTEHFYNKGLGITLLISVAITSFMYSSYLKIPGLLLCLSIALYAINLIMRKEENINYIIINKYVTWMIMSVLYMLILIPLTFRAATEHASSLLAYISIIIIIAAIVIDYSGKYGYIGKILFFTALFVSGLSSFVGLSWIYALFSYICLFFITMRIYK